MGLGGIGSNLNTDCIFDQKIHAHIQWNMMIINKVYPSRLHNSQIKKLKKTPLILEDQYTNYFRIIILLAFLNCGFMWTRNQPKVPSNCIGDNC
jgi:hypothetical protein